MKPITPTDQKIAKQYPACFQRIFKSFNHENRELLTKNFRFGELATDLVYERIYKKGEPILFRLSNPVNDSMYPLHYAIIKCPEGFTASGYHSITITIDRIKDLRP